MTIVGAIALTTIMTVQASASAGATTSVKGLEKDLLTLASVQPLGFPKVLEATRSSSSTGQKDCPDGAIQVFETASGTSGLASEVLGCNSNTAAAALLTQTRTTSTAVSLRPPRHLGGSAIERNIGRSTYAIYWRRGTVVELVALTTNLVAATSSTTSTTVVSSMLTSAQQKTLSNAALKQNSLIH